MENNNKEDFIKQFNLEEDELDNIFIVAFPAKTRTEIEDLLLARYKIFVRINLHHKVAKSAGALKKSTKELILNYLKIDEPDITKGISFLWKSLAPLAMDNMRFANWNDSKLIQELNNALGTLIDDGNLGNTYPELKSSLEEYLQNEDNLIPIIRRGYDSNKLVQEILISFDVSSSDIRKEIDKLQFEEFKNSDKTDSSYDSYLDFLYNDNKEGLNSKSIADLSTIITSYSTYSLETLLSTSLYKKQFLNEILGKLQKEGEIKRFLILNNKGRNKKGIPKLTEYNVFDQIYLYNIHDLVEPLDLNILEEQLNLILEETTPLFLYIEPNPYTTESDVKDFVENYIINEFSLKFKDFYNKLLQGEIIE